jgi:alcohol dehydrogenase (NADP+)
MAAYQGQLDIIIDTVAVAHDLDAYLNLLNKNGHLVLVGAPEHPHPPFHTFNLIFKRRAIAGSLIGGIAETQEMLDFCAEHQVLSDIELIAAKDINEAYERMLNSDVRYRFVIDMATL